MSDEMTNRDYWQEVRELAASIQLETAEDMDGQYGTDWGRDDFEEAVNERLWETIDGHQWVIYTAHNHDVLRFSDNDGYSAENFGAESVIDDHGNINWAALAFGALYGDVMEAIHRDPLDLDSLTENPASA